MRVPRVFLGALMALMVFASPTWSQEAATSSAGMGTLEGLVTDPAQVPLPGAMIQAKSASLGVEKTVLTGADGKYRIADLSPGTDYVLAVSFPGGGYSTVTQDRIVIRPDRITVESVQLFEQLSEKVIVSAKAENRRVVDLEELGTRTEFDAEFLEGLPLLGRNYQDILTLAAGVVDPDNDGNVNVLGARAENFKAEIDGVSNQDVVGGTFASNLNTDAIEAVEVITTGGDASLGRASGSFSRIITKSGSNEMEGTFKLAWRTSLLDGNGSTGQDTGDFQSIRPALSLSGAILKDKLWYFFTSEMINDDFPINTLAGRNTLIREVNGHRTLFKLTWQASNRNKVTGQVRTDPYEFTNLGINAIVLPEAGFTQEQGGPIYNVSLESVFSPRVLLTSRIAYSDNGIGLIPNNAQDPTDNAEFSSAAFDVNLDTAAVSGSYWLNLQDTRERLTWREDLSYFVDDFFGRHDIATGFIYEREAYQADWFQGMVRTFRLQNNFFGSESDPDDAGQKFIVNEQFGIPASEGGLNFLEGDSDNYGLYATDTWLPRDNLSISFGLRWEREDVIADGYTPFDPRAEFNDFSRYMVACNAAVGTPGNESPAEAANNLLASIFPDVFGQYLDNGGSISSCAQGKAFFLTYPKQKFTDDCKRPSDNSFCTETLNQFSPVLVIKGNRPEEPVEFSNSNLAPRFNISWDPWSNGKTKVFASWGRFFDKTNLAVVTLEQGPDTRSRDFIFNTSLGTTTSAGNVASDPDVTMVDRSLSTEFKDEWTIGFEREIAPETKIRLTYIANKFRNQYQDVDYNHYVRDVGPEFIAPVRRTVGGTGGKIVGFVPMGGTAICDFDPVVTGLAPTAQIVGAVENGSIQKTGEYNEPNGTGDDCFGFVANRNGSLQPISDGLPDLFRRNLLYNNILFLSNLNRSEFNGFTLEFIRRLKRNWQVTAGWTHGESVGQADNFQDESGNDPSLVDDEFGYTGFDIRNVVTVSVTTILPWGDLRLGSVLTYISGTPYSIRERESAYDAANQSTFRTVFPTSSRNDQRNDSYQQIDVTLEKAFLIKKYNATGQILIANLLGDDYLTVANFVDGRIQAGRQFGRFYELRFTINF